MCMVLDLEEVLLYLQMTVRPKDEVVTGQPSDRAVFEECHDWVVYDCEDCCVVHFVEGL